MLGQDAENEPKFRCAECNIQFGTPRDLARHLNKTARHGGQPSPCAICHKPLTRPDSRARHERRCRERFGVTEEMWRGIEQTRQRGRRKSISVGTDEDSKPSTESEAQEGSSTSRTASTSKLSPADLQRLMDETQVKFASITARFTPQPGESGSWTRKRAMSELRSGPLLPSDGALTSRKRRESSPPARRAPPPPFGPPRTAPMVTHWHPLNRMANVSRDDSPPYDPPPSPSVKQEDSDGESELSMSTSKTQWTTLARHSGRGVETGPDGDDDEEVDELAGDDDDEPWTPPVTGRAHAHAQGRGHETMEPPPKRKLLGFETDGVGGAVNGWGSQHSQR
ncbi:hypothetical protein BC834DRAFT_514486 [Gloeopeniophorella convolvens]|nr:hypothetical protein BC834DRAFT_514486 [Gloeopeniophorella convolvens]